jgi:hypothetical protein
MQPTCQAILHLPPLPTRVRQSIGQLETDAAAESATSPLNSHPSSSPIDCPQTRSTPSWGGRLIWLHRRRAWARTWSPSNQHVTAQFGSSIGRGLLRGGPPSNKFKKSNRGRWVHSAK